LRNKAKERLMVELIAELLAVWTALVAGLVTLQRKFEPKQTKFTKALKKH
jgi:hypothetical protein